MKIKFIKPKERLKKTREQKMTRRFHVFLILFIVSFLNLAALVYSNFDYLVFKVLITTSYSYTDTLDKLYKGTLKLDDKEIITNYSKNFDDVVIGAVTEKIGSIDGDRYTYLYTPEEFVLQGETTRQIADESRVVEIDPETVHVRIPNISSFTRDFLYNNKEEIAKYSYLILDLRSNYGGNLDHCYKMAELFVDKGSILGYEKTRIFHDHVVKSSRDKYFNFKKIYILQNKNSASAAETIALALKENLDNVVIVGETSFGKGIGQVTLNLKYGYAVKATTLRLSSPRNESIHGIGIAPDIECSSEDALIKALADIKEVSE